MYFNYDVYLIYPERLAFVKVTENQCMNGVQTMEYEASILIIDDEPKVISALARVFKQTGYRLLTTTDAAEAFRILRNENIDLIISDQQMPDISGIDILKYARDTCPDTIRILITAFSDLTVAISAINEGSIFYYIAKPWQNAEVLAVVEKALLYRRQQTENKSVHDILAYSKKHLSDVSVKLNTLSRLLEQGEDEESSYSPGNNPKEQLLDKISVWEDNNIILINITDIQYLAAYDGKTTVFSRNGKYKSPDALNTWEQKLAKHNFLRCHRSYIVNIDQIDKISPWFNGTYNIRLRDLKDNIPVSRSSVKKLKHFLGL